MYPFKVILIGDDEQLMPHLRRELLNQTVEVESEFPTMEVAVERLVLQHDEARLFVIEVDSAAQLETLKHFGGTYSGRPILAVMNCSLDSSSVIKAMRHGASQVLKVPLVPGEFAEALEGILVQFGHLVSRSRVVAVTGAHGGVGVTSVAVNLAYELAQHCQLNTILLELQVNIGVLPAFLQIQPKHSTAELLRMGHSVDLYAIKNSLVPFGDRLSILAGPAHNLGPFAVDPETVTHLIQAASQLADVVVVDVPATMDAFQVEIASLANKMLLVTEQTIPSLQLTMEMLQFGLRTQAPSVVINRYDATLEGFDSRQIQDVLGVADSQTIANDNLSFHAAVNRGQPLRLAAPKSAAIADFKWLAQHVMELTELITAKKHDEGILRRLSHLLGVE